MCIFSSKPHPLRWFSVLELSLKQVGSGYRNLQLLVCHLLLCSWSCAGDKVAAKLLKSNVLNVIEGKIIRSFTAGEQESFFVERDFLCSMTSHTTEPNKNYECSFSFCKNKKFWLIHSIVAQMDKGDKK